MHASKPLSMSSIAAVLLIGASTTRVALAEDSGWYVGAIGGITAQGNQTLDLEDASVPTARVDLGTGFLAGATVGYQFDSPWQVEGEIAYQTVDVDGLTPEAFGPFDDSNFASLTAAVNFRYMQNLFGSEKARAFAGAGLVYLSEVDIDFESAGMEQSFSGDDFGVQFMVGARYKLGEQFYLESGLRYLLASSIDLDGEGDASGRVKADYSPYALTLSLGWQF